MTQVAKNESSILPKLIISIKDINYGMVIVSLYILIEFGSFRIFDWVTLLDLPFVIAVLTLVHAIFLLFTGRIDLKSPVNRSFLGLCTLIIIYTQISTIHVQNKENYTYAFLQYISNYIIIVACVKKPQQFIFLVDVWLFAILHSSYHSIYQGGRVWGTLWLRGENNVGLMCAYAVPFAFFLYINYRDSIKKYFYAICICAYVAAVVVALSRGGFVTLAVVGFLCWLFITFKVRVLFLILIGALLINQFAPEEFFGELQSLEQGTEEGTADERIYSWGLAVSMFRDNPIFGVGTANYPEYFLAYDYEGRFGANASRRNQFRKRVAHSTQFTWLAEFGTVGVILLIHFQLQLYRNWKVLKKYKFTDKVKNPKDLNLLTTMTHANLFTQIGFWVGAAFLSLLNYPFYWVLPAFSEAWKNICIDYVKESKEKNTNVSS